MVSDPSHEAQGLGMTETIIRIFAAEHRDNVLKG